MVKLTTKGEKGEFILNLPTNLSEITSEYLNDVTSSIKVAPNYSLIGICYREAFSSVLFANNTKKKNITTSIVPIFVKCGKSDSEFINSISCGDKLIISASQIALGLHVNAPNNKITINNILDCTKGDTNIYKESLKIVEPCYFLEFKLVPNVDIIGVHDTSNIAAPYVNPFISKVAGGAC